jgi:hypothetical protein
VKKDSLAVKIMAGILAGLMVVSVVAVLIMSII